MRYIDISNPKRVDRNPDKIIELLSNGSITEKGYVIKNIQLRLYIEKHDKKLGQYSLITSLIETDRGSVEMGTIPSQGRSPSLLLACST